MLYVAALSDYCIDINLYDDHYINAMQHSIEYFDDIVNCKWFRRTNFILLLNKDDLFRQRLQNGLSLSLCFGDKWNGPDYPDFQYNDNLIIVLQNLIKKMQINLSSKYVPKDIEYTIFQYSKKEFYIEFDINDESKK